MTRPPTSRLLASRFSDEGRVCPETTAKQNFPTRPTEAQRQQSNGCQGPCSFSRGPLSCPIQTSPVLLSKSARAYPFAFVCRIQFTRQHLARRNAEAEKREIAREGNRSLLCFARKANFFSCTF